MVCILETKAPYTRGENISIDHLNAVQLALANTDRNMNITAVVTLQ